MREETTTLSATYSLLYGQMRETAWSFGIQVFDYLSIDLVLSRCLSLRSAYLGALSLEERRECCQIEGECPQLGEIMIRFSLLERASLLSIVSQVTTCEPQLSATCAII